MKTSPVWAAALNHIAGRSNAATGLLSAVSFQLFPPSGGGERANNFRKSRLAACTFPILPTILEQSEDTSHRNYENDNFSL
jgi:hypothetical protein